jgi:hypothetical protein
VVAAAYFELNQFEAGLDALSTARLIKAKSKFLDVMLGRFYAVLGMMDHLEKSHLLGGEHIQEYTRRLHLGLCHIALANEKDARQQLTLCLENCAIVLAHGDAMRTAGGANAEAAMDAKNPRVEGMTAAQVQANITRKKALQCLEHLDQRIATARAADYEIWRQKLLKIRDRLSI